MLNKKQDIDKIKQMTKEINRNVLSEKFNF